MSKDFIFWLIMLIGLLFGAFGYWPSPDSPRRGYGRFGFAIFVIIELCLLGWRVFGAAVK